VSANLQTGHAGYSQPIRRRAGGRPTIGGEELAIIAGPCALKATRKRLPIAESVRRSGAKFFARSFQAQNFSYAFQDWRNGAEDSRGNSEMYGLKIVTEALDEAGVRSRRTLCRCDPVGARSMQNFTLLRRVGKSRLPVLLKRGLSATLDEWLLAAEYIMSEGNYRSFCVNAVFALFAQHTRTL